MASRVVGLLSNDGFGLSKGELSA